MSIKVQNLIKKYDSTIAVNGVSFEVRSGEVLGFLGPNGAGKTTTMKILTCFIPQNSGKVEVCGMDNLTHSLEIRSKVGYLPELNPLYTDMSVSEFLNYSAKLHSVPKEKINSKLSEVLETCGLNDVRNKDISELSKGYRQRTGLAQALIHDPEVLILDEPTSGLDPNQIIEIRNLIKKIGLAKTVILSTHILSEVQATCDRVIIINKGEIVADGTTEQLIKENVENDTILVEIKANVADPKIELIPALQSIANVNAVELVSFAENKFKLAIASDKSSDISEALFKLAVDKGWILMSMHKSDISLEQVFRDLTKGNNQQADFERFKPNTQD